jgi:hypothetical protein
MRRTAITIAAAALALAPVTVLGTAIAHADSGSCVEQWTAEGWPDASAICEAIYGVSSDDGAGSEVDACVSSQQASKVKDYVTSHKPGRAWTLWLDGQASAARITRSSCKSEATYTTPTSGGVTQTQMQNPRVAEKTSGYTEARDARATADMMAMALTAVVFLVLVGGGVWWYRNRQKPAHGKFAGTPTPQAQQPVYNYPECTPAAPSQGMGQSVVKGLKERVSRVRAGVQSQPTPPAGASAGYRPPPRYDMPEPAPRPRDDAGRYVSSERADEDTAPPPSSKPASDGQGNPFKGMFG